MSEILDAINALGDATADMTLAKESFETVRQDAEQAISDHLSEADAHTQYVKTDTFEQVKKLPIYPEVMSDDSRLAMTLDSSVLTIEANQIIRLYGWLEINTSDYAVRTFSINDTKTYHLRFNLTDGFYLKDLSDVEYNPDSLEDFETAFDTSYDDLLLAEFKSGVLKVYKNVSDIPKGEFAAIETMDSYLISGTQDLMSLEIDHGFARRVNIRVKTQFLNSSTSVGHGYAILSLDEELLYSSERFHVGKDSGGYQYKTANVAEKGAIMKREKRTAVLSSTNESGNVYFNCQWHWTHIDFVSYIKAEIV
ncbi:hypothetical protein [Marinomonas sp. PE14-40]|uniref:hypothetical protein n=1 Tax=Marinomonas sp. PE14-40 TaxID=3060621 RepID=UPI003F665719